MLNQFAFTSDFLTILLGWDKTLLPLYGSDERSTHCQLSLGLQLPAIRCQVCWPVGVHISLFYKITIGWVRYIYGAKNKIGHYSGHSVEIILFDSSSSSSHRHQ